MKAHHIIGLGLIVTTIFFTLACSDHDKNAVSATPQASPAPPPARRIKENPHRLTTIRAADTGAGEKAGTCDVDFPNVVLRTSKQHTIEWQAESQNGPFWIQFVQVDAQGIGHPISAPLVSVTQPIKITDAASSGQLSVDPNAAGPYKYDIWASDPTGVTYSKKCTKHEGESGYPCKCALSDQDTGVIVKP